MCTPHSTDLCSICFVSSISIILCQMLRHKPSSSTQCRWTGKIALMASCRTCCELFFLSLFLLFSRHRQEGKKDAYLWSFCVLCCYTMQVVIRTCTVYCNKQKKNKKVDVRVRQRVNRVSHQHTHTSVSVDFVQTVHGRKKKQTEKKNAQCCRVTVSSTSSQRNRTVRNTFRTLPSPYRASN